MKFKKRQRLKANKEYSILKGTLLKFSTTESIERIIYQIQKFGGLCC
jgi:hypothetical protein